MPNPNHAASGVRTTARHTAHTNAATRRNLGSTACTKERRGQRVRQTSGPTPEIRRNADQPKNPADAPDDVPEVRTGFRLFRKHTFDGGQFGVQCGVDDALNLGGRRAAGNRRNRSGGRRRRLSGDQGRPG